MSQMITNGAQRLQQAWQVAGPPEDSGGVSGLQELLAARADPDHPEHDDAVDWLGDCDPEVFDEVAVQRELGRIVAWRTGRRSHRPGET